MNMPFPPKQRVRGVAILLQARSLDSSYVYPIGRVNFTPLRDARGQPHYVSPPTNPNNFVKKHRPDFFQEIENHRKETGEDLLITMQIETLCMQWKMSEGGVEYILPG